MSGVFDLAAEVAAAIANDSWDAKVETVARRISSRGLGKRVIDMDAGLVAIKSGDPSRMEAWLARRRERLQGVAPDAGGGA